MSSYGWTTVDDGLEFAVQMQDGRAGFADIWPDTIEARGWWWLVTVRDNPIGPPQLALDEHNAKRQGRMTLLWRLYAERFQG